MAEQLGGPFEMFMDSHYSKKRPSPHLHLGTLWRCGDGLCLE